MNLRAFILGTVAANLALVSALLWQTARALDSPPHAGLSVRTNVVTEFVDEPAARPPQAKVSGSPPFHWSQIESTNHLVCLTNLLAIGCPKETVRDILEARVADDYRARLRELVRPFNAQFWEAVADEKIEKLLEGTPTEKAVEELKAERKRVEAELRTNLVEAAKAEKTGRNEQFGHLPEDKQTEIAALKGRHTKELEVAFSEIKKLSPKNRQAPANELLKRQDAELRALLTDSEWAEAELRRSPQTSSVRELRGLTATPDELRSLVRSLRDFDSANLRPVPRDPSRPDDDPAYKAKLEEREAQRKAMLAENLGAAGFAAFERGSDPRFHTLLKLARRLDVQPASAAQWLEIQSAAQEQVRLTRQNVDLAGDARAVALLAIRAETERTLQAAVGARGWGAYQRHAGDWLKQLTE
ncbi:MAG: hypothetical protein HZA92_15775 [Verrucomicrobia bacterium]|nr:hypothetical protein [Verrucomicrobiota bacterium]